VPKLPPEDRPDTISVGPVRDIPVYHEDDPRLADERAQWSAARRVAQAAHSADELLAGLGHEDWRVRHEVIDRLVARAADDERTLPALIACLADDPAWQVRSVAAMSLKAFPDDVVRTSLERAAAADLHDEVRSSALFALGQMDGG
jgi:HEAT repeat protein